MPDTLNLSLYVVSFISLYFEIFLLINLIEHGSEIKQKARRPIKKFPSVTVLVPVFNEEKTITKTILSILNLDYPKDKLKIIIINDGSTDSTPKVIRKFEKNKNIKIIHKENGGKFTALNMGLLHVESDLVSCLDADSFVLPETLKKMIPYFDDSMTMAVTPAIKIYKPDSFIRHVQNNEYNLGIFMRKSFSTLDAITITPGPFSTFRKKVFDNLGGFRPAHNTEDMEIAMRMQKNFYRIENAHDALVYTVGPNSIPKLYKQRSRWIKGFLSNTIDYRFMFFKKEHKHLGVFVMPSIILGIFLFFMSTGIVINNLLHSLSDRIIKLQTIGWNFYWTGLHFDWFFVNTDSRVFLGITLLLSAVFLILLGKKMSEDRIGKISIHLFLFPFVYGPLSLLWLTKGIYATIFSKEIKWR